jgi:hypothetical protein
VPPGLIYQKKPRCIEFGSLFSERMQDSVEPVQAEFEEGMEDITPEPKSEI